MNQYIYININNINKGLIKNEWMIRNIKIYKGLVMYIFKNI